jgi:hypothetical protein
VSQAEKTFFDVRRKSIFHLFNDICLMEMNSERCCVEAQVEEEG